MRLQLLTSSDWDDVQLVVFDVDGTLYRQRQLRLRIGRELLMHTVLKRDVNVITVLSKYRGIRERLASEEAFDFENLLIAETAAATANPPDKVRSIISEWIEQRPVPYLAACRYPGVSELFAGLKRSAKVIGILSDYPVSAKLNALKLTPDFVVSSGDKGIEVLKPNPRGLEFLIASARTTANATVVIGDRPDRDGMLARRAGAKALIKSLKPIEGWQTFASFDDPLFAPLLHFNI
jgi:putative hydrolase of the HAD superfamily